MTADYVTHRLRAWHTIESMPAGSRFTPTGIATMINVPEAARDLHLYFETLRGAGWLSSSKGGDSYRRAM